MPFIHCCGVVNLLDLNPRFIILDFISNSQFICPSNYRGLSLNLTRMMFGGLLGIGELGANTGY